jgi:hypothetical protein
MSNLRLEIILRDVKATPIVIKQNEDFCLWIHDTYDKNLSGYSEGELGEFLEASYIVYCINEFSRLTHFEYVPSGERLYYYKSYIMKIYGTCTNPEQFMKELLELSCLVQKDPDDITFENALEHIECGIANLSSKLWEEDMWTSKDCPIPELLLETKKRQLLYSIVFDKSEGDSFKAELINELKRIAPDFPEDQYHGGPNIS